jgi:hypothetical protein
MFNETNLTFVISEAEFKQKHHSILAQMWQYNSGLRTLDNKNGSWKYLHISWTLPLKEETEEMRIETLQGNFLGLKNKKEVVLLFPCESV